MTSKLWQFGWFSEIYSFRLQPLQVKNQIPKF